MSVRRERTGLKGTGHRSAVGLEKEGKKLRGAPIMKVSAILAKDRGDGKAQKRALPEEPRIVKKRLTRKRGGGV